MSLLKTKKEIEAIREGGYHLGAIMDMLIGMVKPGITTGELEAACLAAMKKIGGTPSFLGYQPSFGHAPFPSALCTSINDELVHAPALPSRSLKEGDIIGIDVGMIYKGLFTDMARTVPVGKINDEAKKLLTATQEALEVALAQLGNNISIYEVGVAVEKVAKQYGCGVVEELVGHGVGHAVHEDPQVPNFKDATMKKSVCKTGMVLAVEPMLTAGKKALQVLPDDWTFATKDGSLSAQFENTIAITDTGVEILTPTQWRFKIKD